MHRKERRSEKAPKRNGKTAFELRSELAAKAFRGCSIFSSSYLIIIVCLLCAATEAPKACDPMKKLGELRKSSHVLPSSAVLAFLGRTLSFLGRMCNKVMHSNCLCDCDGGNAFFVETWVCAFVCMHGKNAKNEHAFDIL